MATDTYVDPKKDGKIETFVMAVEGQDYPFFGVMFHPETQTISIFSEDKAVLEGKINNEVTDSIMYHFSELVHNQAMLSLQSGTHKFKDSTSAHKSLYLTTEIDLHEIYTSKLLTYGLN